MMFAGFKSPPGKQDRQVATGMGTGIAHAATKENHRGVKKRPSIGILRFLHPVKEARKLASVVQLYYRQLPQ